jgi:NADPH:quinone reductase-like Zn-dependent oxidoreductase
MRAAGITALGESVEIFEVDELATPAAGEVLIDVVAAGIGPWDELVRIGSWQIGGPAPMALGTETAGTVAAVGSGVAELREGDEVMTHPLPLRRHGTWAGRVLAPAATVAARPPEASWEAAGAFPFRRSLRLRHSTRLWGSRAAAGSSSTEPAELRVACSFSSPRRGEPA